MKAVLLSATKVLRERNGLSYKMPSSINFDHKQISLEKLESLSHDPAAVTGSTRTASGWRAVEDIHQRHMEQLEILNGYINASQMMDAQTISFTREMDICRSNKRNLSEIADKRSQVFDVIVEAEHILTNVKSLRSGLKTDYDAAEKHTSASYPEVCT